MATETTHRIGSSSPGGRGLLHGSSPSVVVTCQARSVHVSPVPPPCQVASDVFQARHRLPLSSRGDIHRRRRAARFGAATLSVFHVPSPIHRSGSAVHSVPCKRARVRSSRFRSRPARSRERQETGELARPLGPVAKSPIREPARRHPTTQTPARSPRARHANPDPLSLSLYRSSWNPVSQKKNIELGSEVAKEPLPVCPACAVALALVSRLRTSALTP